MGRIGATTFNGGSGCNSNQESVGTTLSCRCSPR
ncbi:MAG: hypothetical protein JWM13_917, partial [Arthrobacter sp.]|nr:hypothetical protein [Arthrobacter sp.]